MFKIRKPLFSVGQVLYRIDTTQDTPQAFKIIKTLDYDKHLDGYEYEAVTLDTQRQFWFWEAEYERGEICETLNEATTRLIKHKTAEIHHQLINTAEALKVFETALQESEKQKELLRNLLKTNNIAEEVESCIKDFLLRKSTEYETIGTIEAAIESVCNSAVAQHF